MDITKSIPENTEEQVAVFNMLADPTRLKLVRLLCRQRDPDALCVNALAAILGVTQSDVSQHLRGLKAIGLVKGERRGYHIHYFLNRESLDRCHKLVSAALGIEEPVKGQSCQESCTDRREQNVSRD
jgi:ArsR family transcriptional regulator